MQKAFFLITRNFTYLGNMFPQSLICLFLCFIDFQKAFYVTGLWGWSYFINAAIKNFVKRPRPNPSAHKVKVSGYSFPSGHSLTSLALYFSIASYFNPDEPLLYVLYALPFLLGLTRVYFGVHNWSDVIGGWVIAYIYLYFAQDFLNYVHGYFYEFIYEIFKVFKMAVFGALNFLGFSF